MNISDTVAAVATPEGVGALGIVRMSGSNAFDIAGRIFKSVSGKKISLECRQYCLKHGVIHDTNVVIDEVMMTVMKSPHSYTGEDMIEIICHGSSLIITRILDLCLDNGAKAAEPGEFTRRAFLNNKMDLTQAESVNHLINAHSARAQEEAVRILRGELKEKMGSLKDRIIRIKANIDADIEWGETENINILSREKIKEKITECTAILEDMIRNSQPAEKVIRGRKIVICGKPNAGKSSLFNCILKSSRSITSRIPGTTRDVIEIDTMLGGSLVNLVDTAGIGLDLKTIIDKEAVKKSRQEIRDADMIIYVIDGKTGIEPKDSSVKRLLKGKHWIPVINKCDLKIKIDEKVLKRFCLEKKFNLISCKKGQGIKELIELIRNFLIREDNGKLMVTCRQKQALKDAMKNLKNSMDILWQDNYRELVSYEINEMMKDMGKIDGSTLEQEVLDSIFREFCIGK
ncbi:MAG: tRNA uridine-5-carboxymethylaminomethyl(34) synthesis GTPase MnmE [Elusimicrobiota bacterium]